MPPRSRPAFDHHALFLPGPRPARACCLVWLAALGSPARYASPRDSPAFYHAAVAIATGRPGRVIERDPGEAALPPHARCCDAIAVKCMPRPPPECARRK